MDDSDRIETFDEWKSDTQDSRRTAQSYQHNSQSNTGIAIVVLLFAGIIVGGLGVGMSDTTQVDKTVCVEEDYSGECVEESSVEYQESEQNPMKPVVMGIGGIMIVGAIVVYGMGD